MPNQHSNRRERRTPDEIRESIIAFCAKEFQRLNPDERKAVAKQLGPAFAQMPFELNAAKTVGAQGG